MWSISNQSMHGMAMLQAAREALHSGLAYSGCAAADHSKHVLDSLVKPFVVWGFSLLLFAGSHPAVGPAQDQ